MNKNYYYPFSILLINEANYQMLGFLFLHTINYFNANGPKKLPISYNSHIIFEIYSEI